MKIPQFPLTLLAWRCGSHGVILKAPDVPAIVDAVARLAEAGIPVVTLVTDLPTTSRAAYVGLDSQAAGATAAYLLAQWLGAGPATSWSSAAAARSVRRTSVRWAYAGPCGPSARPAFRST